MALSLARAFGLVILLSNIAGAANSPCGYYRHTFSGVASRETNYGARAGIEPHKPALCSTTSFSAAWVMVSGSRTTADKDGFAQSGYGRFGQDAPYEEAGMQIFAAWLRDLETSTKIHIRFLPKPEETENYRVAYHFGDGHLHMYVGQRHFGESGFDPVVQWKDRSDGTSGVLTWDVEYVGEVLHPTSDIPGTQADPVNFYNMKKRNRDGDWVNVAFSDIQRAAGGRFYQSWDTYREAQHIWTHPL